MKINWKVVSFLAIAHYIITVALIVWSFGAGMAWIDTGAPSTHSEQIVSAMANILYWPGYPISKAIGFGKPWQIHFLVQILNSLLWATGLYLLLAGLLRAVREMHRDRAST